jgi:hypothetical protein
VDYAYNMMLEYFWLGPHLGVPDRRSFNHLRRRPIGAKYPEMDYDLPSELEAIVQLGQMTPTRQRAARAYFALMATHFEDIERCLRPGSRYVMVVGNSQTVNGVVPLHDAISALARSAGLRLEMAFGYRIRRHYMKFPRSGRGGIILIDWVLVFQKGLQRVTRQALPAPWVTLAPDAVAH